MNSYHIMFLILSPVACGSEFGTFTFFYIYTTHILYSRLSLFMIHLIINSVRKVKEFVINYHEWLLERFSFQRKSLIII